MNSRYWMFTTSDVPGRQDELFSYLRGGIEFDEAFVSGSFLGLYRAVNQIRIGNREAYRLFYLYHLTSVKFEYVCLFIYLFFLT